MDITHNDKATLSDIRTSLYVLLNNVLPITESTLRNGNNIFGGAVVSRGETINDSIPLAVGVNRFSENPINHGEIVTLNTFFSNYGTDFNISDCFFVSSHKPCLMCMSAIYWAGFKKVYYLFDYEDTADLFFMPDDLKMVDAFVDGKIVSQNNLIDMVDMGKTLLQYETVKNELDREACFYYVESIDLFEQVREEYIDLAPLIVKNVVQPKADKRSSR